MASAKARWIETFIEELAAVPSGASFSNFYSYSETANAVRRHNLTLYFRDLCQRSPNVLLVGECPGYRGTKVTGVPFADVPLVLKGVEQLEMFGFERGYRPPLETHYPQKEQTSTTMWKVLAHFRFVPLLWASFPFHPYEDKLDSNRAPSRDELMLGREFLSKIIADWSIDTVVAVGRVAENSLGTLKVPCQHIRHPARGGKRDFEAGVGRLLSDGISRNSAGL